MRWIVRKIKRALMVSSLQISFFSKIIKSRKRERIYILSVPYHGNLGDQAIAYGQVEYLKGIVPNREIIEIYMPDVKFFLKLIQKLIRPYDVICVHGGGNMGNQYPIEEEIRRRIIEAFPQNRVVLFPQTIYFTKDTRGREELAITEEIYNNHNNLTIVGREKISYEAMKKSFPRNNVIFTPDIVLNLNKQDEGIKRESIFVCLRSDVEGIISEDTKRKLIDLVKSNYDYVEIGDTVIRRDIKNKEREYELEKIWNQFRGAKVVITDRLHGMIFAAITGTPCVVLNNYNHKVSGEYEWIKDLQHITLVNEVDVESIMKQVDKLYKFDHENIKISDLRTDFEQLSETIQNSSK